MRFASRPDLRLLACKQRTFRNTSRAERIVVVARFTNFIRPSGSPSCIPVRLSASFLCMSAARERINLALKILSSRHDAKQHVTASDVNALKSCVRGDVTGRSVYEIATAVIRAELARQQRESERETAPAKRA